MDRSDLIARLEASVATLELRIENCRVLINTGPVPLEDLVEAALRPPMPKDFQIPALPGMFEVKLLQELRPAIDVMREAAALLRSEAGE